MNTIIIHSHNRIRAPTLMHELNAALISPVSKWYRKPTPWWVDDFEEEGLYLIVEEEEEEEEEAMVEEEEVEEEEEEEEEEEDIALAGEDGIFVDTSLTHNGIPSIMVTSPSDGDLVHIVEAGTHEFDYEDIANGTYKDYLLDASLYNWYMRFYSSTLAKDSTAPVENDNTSEDLRTAISTSAIDDEEQDILEMIEVQNMVDENEEFGLGFKDEALEMLNLTGFRQHFQHLIRTLQYHLGLSTKTSRAKDALLSSGVGMGGGNG